MLCLGLVVLVGLVVNLIGFLAMAIDKYASKSNGHRIPERKIIRLAWLGGVIGVYVGMKVFRHKIRKVTFRTRLQFIFILQVVLLTTLTYLYIRYGWS